MSRISRYQESISKFIKTKSSYSDIIKSNSVYENIINLNDHEASIILLTVLNGQYKKKNLKAHHGYYMSSGIDLMMTYVMINDNLNYYETKFGKNFIKNITNRMVIHVHKCLKQNIETLENMIDKDKVLKIYKNISNYVNKKMEELTECVDFKTNEKAHRTDIIKYKFSEKNIIENKYRKLNVIDKDLLVNYVDRTYGSVCQCAFVVGWLLGLGEDKMINNLEKLGSHLGLIIKLAKDFKNLERDINSAVNGLSNNLIVNHGIHQCFELFNESKTSLLEGCLTLDIYNITVKEVIDYIENTFDDHLKNTDLELNSRYSSFS